jgi:hypothetical protein
LPQRRLGQGIGRGIQALQGIAKLVGGDQAQVALGSSAADLALTASPSCTPGMAPSHSDWSRRPA